MSAWLFNQFVIFGVYNNFKQFVMHSLKAEKNCKIIKITTTKQTEHHFVYKLTLHRYKLLCEGKATWLRIMKK